MKYWTLPLLVVSLAQVACSGGSTGVDGGDPTLTNPASGVDGLQSDATPIMTSSLMNNGGIGPDPNFWNCRLRQNDANVALETSYQYFTDLTGVYFIGPSSFTFSWDVTGADSGYIDLINDSGDIPVERWFLTMRSPTVFAAAIAYRQSLDELADASLANTNANIDCVLHTEDGAVNPDDADLLNQFDDGPGDGSGGDITSIAQTLLNRDSEFGLERQLWQCIAIDGSLDLLIGFYNDGIGAIYSTRSGELEGSQGTYTVSERDGIGTVTFNAVLNNQADLLEFSNVIFERNSQFEARLQSTVSNIDALISCNTIFIAELPL